VAIASGVLLAGALAVSPMAYQTWRARNLNANESAAVAVLKFLSSAQAQIKASAAVDVNKNGAGEYGTLAQLAALHLWRPAEIGRQLSPTRLELGGYVYELVLPTAPADREVKWTCYAWPAELAISGRRTFVITQAGDILASQNCDRFDGERAPTLGRSGFCNCDGCAPRVAANTIDDEGVAWSVW
jgi:hypothetical protein